MERRKPCAQTEESLVTMVSFSSQLWKLTQAKLLTGKEHIVLQALASFKGDKGLFPSHTTIAIRAGCSCSTVIRTLKKAYELGLVEKVARRNVHSSGRIVRGTNLYTLKRIDLVEAKKLMKERTQKLKDALERKKRQFLNGFSKFQNQASTDSKSLISSKRNAHLSVQEYLSLVEGWCMEQKIAQE